jgi:hypothetical protein
VVWLDTEQADDPAVLLRSADGVSSAQILDPNAEYERVTGARGEPLDAAEPTPATSSTPRRERQKMRAV